MSQLLHDEFQLPTTPATYSRVVDTLQSVIGELGSWRSSLGSYVAEYAVGWTGAAANAFTARYTVGRELEGTSIDQCEETITIVNNLATLLEEAGGLVETANAVATRERMSIDRDGAITNWSDTHDGLDPFAWSRRFAVEGAVNEAVGAIEAANQAASRLLERITPVQLELRTSSAQARTINVHAENLVYLAVQGFNPASTGANDWAAVLQYLLPEECELLPFYGSQPFSQTQRVVVMLAAQLRALSEEWASIAGALQTAAGQYLSADELRNTQNLATSGAAIAVAITAVPATQLAASVASAAASNDLSTFDGGVFADYQPQNFACWAFVQAIYEREGLQLPDKGTAQEAYQAYRALPSFHTGLQPPPPVGAIVFFSYGGDGHVGIGDGSGGVISTQHSNVYPNLPGVGHGTVDASGTLLLSNGHPTECTYEGWYMPSAKDGIDVAIPASVT